jgi:hypothetical protein
MKGIYLTEEAKKEIEAKIAELEKEGDIWSDCFGIAMDVYQKILSSATILPVEESWRKCGIVNRKDREYVIDLYPNGVIIKK